MEWILIKNELLIHLRSDFPQYYLLLYFIKENKLLVNDFSRQVVHQFFLIFN